MFHHDSILLRGGDLCAKWMTSQLSHKNKPSCEVPSPHNIFNCFWNPKKETVHWFKGNKWNEHFSYQLQTPGVFQNGPTTGLCIVLSVTTITQWEFDMYWIRPQSGRKHMEIWWGSLIIGKIHTNQGILDYVLGLSWWFFSETHRNWKSFVLKEIHLLPLFLWSFSLQLPDYSVYIIVTSVHLPPRTILTVHSHTISKREADVLWSQLFVT